MPRTTGEGRRWAVTQAFSPPGSWAGGDRYEAYVGRWSRPVARRFVASLAVPAGARWLDVGCGTGALSETVLAAAEPSAVLGVDPSPDFVAHAAAHVTDPQAAFREGSAQALPADDAAFDAVVSGLVLNFVPDPAAGLAEMRRVARQDGIVAAYVWDYAGGMQLMRRFWDAAAELDPAVRDLDEALRFPLCRPEPLRGLFTDAGLGDVEVEEIVVPTVFADFDDYWTPFLGGTGPAPAYAAHLPEHDRAALREGLRSLLPAEADGSIHLTARAWAVRGRCSSHAAS
jgi:SAM-dependent methyltransferase